MTTQKFEKIRAVPATVNGNRIVFAEWEKNVQVLDINNGLVSKFSTDKVCEMKNAIYMLKLVKLKKNYLGEPIEIEFIKQGSLMLTSPRKLYSTLTGQQIKQFNFENE